MPRFSIEVTIVLEAPDDDEAFRIVREEYAILHDPKDMFKSEQFYVGEVIELEDGQSAFE